MYLHGTSSVDGNGELSIGGVRASALAERFGTPLYVVDEALVRERCRAFVQAFRESGLPFVVSYASKAFCVKAMVRVIAEEGLSLDVASDGELYTALEAGFPPERIHFHGNNKTPEEIAMGLDAGVGCFVVDNFMELHVLSEMAAKRGKRAAVQLRVTPGVEAHTHEFIATGREDSKFGFDLGSGAAMRAVREASASPHLDVFGVHSHIGSQIFETDGFRLAAEKVADFAAQVKAELGVSFRVVNVGGGFGIRYVDGDRPLAVSAYVNAIADAVKERFLRNGLDVPAIWIEPGRSIVGDAGTTLYTIGAVKDIPGVRKYVAVNGGMADNPRTALYGARYEALLARRANEEPQETVSVAGKCCESGDMLIWDARLPKVAAGDLLAVFCTGAYNYSMASNYNRLRRPAVVFVKDGAADLVVRRETHADLVANDIVPERLRSTFVV